MARDAGIWSYVQGPAKKGPTIPPTSMHIEKTIPVCESWCRLIPIAPDCTLTEASAVGKALNIRLHTVHTRPENRSRYIRVGAMISQAETKGHYGHT